VRLDTTQHLGLQQQMKLAPWIIQSMEILQLPMMALQERIDAELQSNPVLELREGDSDEVQTPAHDEDTAGDRGEQDMVVDEGGNGDDFERLADMEAEYGPGVITDDAPVPRPRADAEAGDRKMEAMANAPAPAESLTDHLLGQWAFVETDEPIRHAGEQIISYIEKDGYLRTPLEELAAQSTPPASLTTLQEALRRVQELEPTGVGARELRECLLLQLEAERAAGADVSLEAELVRHFLRDIENNRLPQIARRLRRSIDDVKAAIRNLSHLHPRPGLLIGQQAAPVIRPDVIVDLDEDGAVVVSDPDGQAPRLRIARQYRRMATDRNTDKTARQFLRKNIRSAQWLLGAIEQRRETIRRVTAEVFHAQRDFLDAGPEALRPLPMIEVARRVGVHVATVSRAVAGKYVQTPHGIFPLRMFFSGGTTTAGGEDVSWSAVQAKLREIVAAEDKAQPLSDDQLAAELKKHGIEIARRTVAKYRKLMDIPPARKRKQY